KAPAAATADEPRENVTAKAPGAKAPERTPAEAKAPDAKAPAPERGWHPEASPAPNKLRPVEPAAQQRRQTGFAPANDDRRKDYRSLLQSLNRPAPQTVLWITAAFSLLWVVGGIFALQA